MSKEATARSAMKLALEALELSAVTVDSFGVQNKTQRAITALREALTSVPDWASEAKEQPAQQEPVAWAISYDGKTPYLLWTDGDGVLIDLEVKRQGGATCKLPLYTSPPPQRKPLTDEEIVQIELSLRQYNNRDTYDLSLKDFARAIEAAHGIKEKNT